MACDLRRGLGWHLLVLAMVLASVTIGRAARAEIAGEAQVIDGDTLEIAGQQIDLWGIDAPELDQVCTRAGRDYPCGQVARAALWDLVAGADVVCQPVEGAAGAAAAVVATCEAGGFSLNENMVYTGWALADRAAGERYMTVEAGAKQAGRGLWRGEFEPPATWRKRAG